MTLEEVISFIEQTDDVEVLATIRKASSKIEKSLKPVVQKSYEPQAKECAEQLRDEVLKKYPHYEKTINITKWYEDIEKIPNQADAFNYQVIGAVITWLFNFDTRDAEFWRGNIRSARNLRENFVRLYDRAKDDIEGSQVMTV